MSRSTVIIGNGLGMALNPNYFSLRAGIDFVWKNKKVLSEEHKALIVSAIEETSEDSPPTDESQLDKLQVALIATEFLSLFEKGQTSWLSEKAKNLPAAFKQFIHEVAFYFHKSNLRIPDDFSGTFSQWINSTKSHVATLNYDNLLYDAFKTTKILNGYSGTLLDGFWSDGFKDERLDRHNIQTKAWYLHLHGSPLFVGNRKLMGEERSIQFPDENSHIVLTHFSHKPLIIATSEILNSYWRRLDIAMDESEEIILFGYAGSDQHLNKRITARKNLKTLKIVEWHGSGERKERMAFWRKCTGFDKFELLQYENILNHRNW